MADITIHEEIILSGSEDSDVIMEEVVQADSPKRRPSAAMSPGTAASVDAGSSSPEITGESAKKRRSSEDEDPHKKSR
ncbi:hypothetical protein FHG87_007570 [Trinorchestia longiramus]|nr:hypothetical protein FHG87_007570 [Trinorchestia longiramus]